MIGSLLALTLLAAPGESPGTLGLVLARRTGVSAQDASVLEAQIAEALQAAHLPLVPPPELRRRLSKLGLTDGTACKGKPECVAELGRQLQVGEVVMVSLSAFEEDRSLGLELLEVGRELILERDAVLLSGKARLKPELLEGFIARLRTHLTPTEGPPAAEARAELKTPPPEGAPPPKALLPPPPSTGFVPMPIPAPATHTRGVVLISAGGALLVTAAVLLGVGLAANAELSRGTPGADGVVRSTLTASQAQALAGKATLELGAAGGAGLVGLGLGTAAILTW